MENSSWNRARAALLAAALLLFLPNVASLGLWAPDEPRAAAVTREMFAMKHGAESLVLLRLNEEPYTQKPPLYYWMASAVSLLPGEVTEWSARTPSILAGLATLWLTLAFGRRLFDAPTALLGAAILLTTFSFAELSRRVQFDVVLTFFELGALAAFWRMDRGAGDPNRNRLLAHASMGLALLVKGPVGFLLPVLSWAGFLWADGRLREIGRIFSPGALLLSLGPILAWLGGAVALAPPGFFGTAVGGGVVSRFFEGTSHARPFYYFLYQFPVEFLPWTLLAPAVVSVGRREVFGSDESNGDRRRAWRFALACLAVTFVFFSLSAGKRGLYVLPCFPVLALLCADALRGLLARSGAPPRWLGVTFGALGLALAALGVWSLTQDDVAGAHVPLVVSLGLVAIPVAAAVGWLRVVRRNRPLAIAAVLVLAAWAVLAVVFGRLYPALDPVRSMKLVAEAARRHTPSEQPLALLGSRPMIGGLSYYAEGPIHWIDDLEDVPAYFESGGVALITKASKLERLQAIAPVTVRETVREGDRALLIVRYTPDGEAPPGRQ